MLRLVFIVIVLLGLASRICWGDWAWPEQMTMAGFSVTGISGTVNADGSGAASGAIQVPGASAALPVDIKRSAGGDISGSCTVNVRVDGAAIRGNGVLNSSGLRVTGQIEGSIRTISDATMTVDPKGRFQGSGQISLGALTVPVSITITQGGLAFRGSAPVEAQCDTPLALYKFGGSLLAEGASGRLVLTASGTVERTGKLADQVTTHSINGIQVNLNDGAGPADVGGVKLRFKFF